MQFEGDDLFAQSASELAGTEADSMEQRLIDFASSAESCRGFAIKVRSAINILTEDARLGRVRSAQSRIAKLSVLVDGLAEGLAGLAAKESALRPGSARTEVVRYAEEINQALGKHGIQAVKGPPPFWLVYPASFKIDSAADGGLAVVLNGTRLDTVRPSQVADAVLASVTDKFEPAKFAADLDKVRRRLQRLGVQTSSVLLDDTFEFYQSGAAQRTALSKADFLYAVHRLAESFRDWPNVQMRFPPSDRSEVMFFTRAGDSRRYLTVQFSEGDESQ